MAESCCHKKTDDLAQLAQRQSTVLWIVLVINLAMFVVEFYSGWRYESTALTGDSLDMFGDAVAYASSLFVVGMSLGAKARASQLKASIMIFLGVFVGLQAIYRLLYGLSPVAEAMGIVGVVALVANLICLALLTRHRQDDINFSSVWVCSRNDIIANSAVLLAAFLVSATATPWPDLIIGLGIAFLFIKSAVGILTESNSALNSSARSSA